LLNDVWEFAVQPSRKILVEDCDSAQRAVANTIALSNEQQMKLESLLVAKRLDNSQRQAIRVVMKHRFSMIQGPPGTGKTTTTCALVNVMLDRQFN